MRYDIAGRKLKYSHCDLVGFDCSSAQLTQYNDKDAWKVVTKTFEQQFKQWVGSGKIVKQVYSDKHYQSIPCTAKHKALLG